MSAQPPSIIQINTGAITIPVKVDNNPTVDITFNPNDASFAKKLHSFYFEAKEKLVEVNMQSVAKPKEAPKADENGMPLEIDSIMSDYDEINRWLREKIDILLGDGISQKIFGDTVYTGERVDVYFQLFDGLFQIAGIAREEKVKKYVRKPKNRK